MTRGAYKKRPAARRVDDTGGLQKKRSAARRVDDAGGLQKALGRAPKEGRTAERAKKSARAFAQGLRT
jgi:hypothetical protein